MHPRLRTWLQLFRAPNLFTVPGDPLAGFLIANYGVLSIEMLFVIGASLCFYAAGLLDNDLADLAEDRAERPNRPLPSGAATIRSVWIATCGLTLLGLFLCVLAGGRAPVVGCAIVVAVGLYNHGVKRVPVLGALNMGLCRALSVILGASTVPVAVFPREAIAAATVIGLFIAAVTNLARFETRVATPLTAKWLPPLVLLCSWFAAWICISVRTPDLFLLHTMTFQGLLACAMALSITIAAGLTRKISPAPVPPSIGKFIRLLLLIQAAFCAHTGTKGLIIAGFLLALYPISRAVGKRFYAS
ncbi:MAG: puitative transferase [Chthoniobacteraceae bacterium]|nr:puitative transferase [Chthoniobacteraceae bacterium]